MRRGSICRDRCTRACHTEISHRVSSLELGCGCISAEAEERQNGQDDDDESDEVDDATHGYSPCYRAGSAGSYSCAAITPCSGTGSACACMAQSGLVRLCSATNSHDALRTLR